MKNTHTNKTDIIILGLSRWDGRYYSSTLSLAREFAKNSRVFYIDHPFTLKDLFRMFRSKSIQSRLLALLFGLRKYKKVSSMPYNFTAVTPRLMLPINFLRDGQLYDRLSELNNRIFNRIVRKIIQDFKITDYVFINSFDPYYNLGTGAGPVKPRHKIYLTLDDISQENYIARHGARLENLVIGDSDLTFATSRELTRMKSLITDKVYYLPNAADFSLFERARTKTLFRPRDLPAIMGKTIVYIGHVDFRINYPLVARIAREYHKHQLVLVGPVSDTSGVDELYSIQNVVFTGSKSLEDLPAYLQYSHCAIIPFVCNTLTKSIYPLKINEYLATGIPVVTTAFSEDIQSFGEVAYVANDESEFIRSIGLALFRDTPDQARLRIEMAGNNSWEARVEHFWQVIDTEKQASCMTA